MASIPHISFVMFDAILLQEHPKPLLERPRVRVVQGAALLRAEGDVNGDEAQ